jgi:hypothetical protein
MNLNVFNSKVNLPKFCAKLGYKDYQFVRMPTFGWFAYNKDKSFVGNVFDVVSQKDREYLYSVISKDKPEYLDFELAYSDMSETQIKYNLLEVQLWTAAYSLARKELETYKVQYKGKRESLKEVLIANGLVGLLDNNIGVLTSSILDKFKMLPWPSRDLRGKLIIPTFCTPYHICSLEYCHWDKPTELFMLFLNDEKGWYGNLNHNYVAKDIKELCTTPGNTWDYKADYWYEGIVKLSEYLDVSDGIKIWTESQNTMFNVSPLKHIINSGKVGELKNYVGQLSYNQLQEIEELTGEKLIDYWRKAREHQVQLGDKVFTKRNNCYYVYKKGELVQLTNFAIDIEKIIKTKTGKFVRKGLLHFGTNTIPFEMDEKHFTTNYRFHKGIKEKFLSAGLGVPIVHPDFFGKALLIIDSFNSGVRIETA